MGNVVFSGNVAHRNFHLLVSCLVELDDKKSGQRDLGHPNTHAPGESLRATVWESPWLLCSERERYIHT